MGNIELILEISHLKRRPIFIKAKKQVYFIKNKHSYFKNKRASQGDKKGK